jgi:NPCBM/NEW2 domain
MLYRVLPAVFFAAVCAIPAGSVCGADLTTLDGKKLSGEIVAIANGELTFKTTAGVEEKMFVTAINAIDIGQPPKPPVSGTKFTAIELTDGSTFRASTFQIDQKVLIFESLSTGPEAPARKITVPMASLYSLLRDAQDLKVEQDFRTLLRSRGKFDIWVTRKKGKNDEGKEFEALDGVPGTFGDGDLANDAVKFTLEATGNTVPVKLSRVQGMIFNQIPNTAAPAICRVIDVANNALVAQAITRTATGFTIKTVSGITLELPEALVARFDFAAGSVKYLSDLEPVAAEETGSDPERYQKDKNLDKGIIRFDMKAKDGIPQDYKKGITLHAKTVLTYELKGQYKLFKAVAGVDFTVETPSQCRLTIETGGQPLFRGVIKRGDKPVELNLNIQNADKLKITVESDGGILDTGNQLSLGDARVLK